MKGEGRGGCVPLRRCLMVLRCLYVCCSTCVRAATSPPPCNLTSTLALAERRSCLSLSLSSSRSTWCQQCFPTMIKRFAALVDSSAVKRQFVNSMFAKSSKAHPSSASYAAASSASPAKVSAQRVTRQVNVKDEHVCIDLEAAAGAEASAANVISIESESESESRSRSRSPSRQDCRLQGPGASTRRTGAPVVGSRKVAGRNGGDVGAAAAGAAGAVRGASADTSTCRSSATTPPSRAKRRSADRDLVPHRHADGVPLPAGCQRKKTLHSYFSAI